MMQPKKIAIIGTVGLPAQYGGFETLVDNLVLHAQSELDEEYEISVYCSAPNYEKKLDTYSGAKLVYSRFRANGPQSIIYDVITSVHAVFRGNQTLLVLGVSGAIIFPFIKLLSRTEIITNVDGIEWKREKWKGIAKKFLRYSEKLAVRFSNKVIADNKGIAEYINTEYGISPSVIAYGGDNALRGFKKKQDKKLSQTKYALALCRIEPENNVEMILRAFENAPLPLIFIGNWNNSEFGRTMRQRFGTSRNIKLVDPIYDPEALFEYRRNTSIYVHGHSAGGTNPSLVEMMFMGKPIAAFDCNFNRYTTSNLTSYFSNTEELRTLLDLKNTYNSGKALLDEAKKNYRWETIANQYFDLIGQ